MKNLTPKTIKGLALSLIATFALCALSPALDYKSPATAPSKPQYESVNAKVNSWIPSAYAAPDDPPATPPAGGDATATPAAGGAAGTTGETKQILNFKDLLTTAANLARYVNFVFYPMINFFAFQIGNFLGTDYIYTDKMGEMLHDIWVVSRNIVNILFVLILLFLALKEIFRPGGEGGDIKKTLGTFALLLIAVNFSWLATKVVLDAANVATNVAFSIPSGVASTGVLQGSGCDVKYVDGQWKAEGLCYPTQMYIPTDATSFFFVKEDDCNKKDKNGKTLEEQYNAAFPDTGKGDQGAGFYTDVTKVKPGADGKPVESKENIGFLLRNTAAYCWNVLDTNKFKKNTATIYLTYGMARIQNLIQSNVQDASHLAVGTFFSFLMMIAYLLAIGALFISLVIRMAFLWIFVAFSPFLVLLAYLGLIGMGGEQVKGFSYQAFIKWAFVPAKVGLVFSVAFLMVAAGQKMGLDNPGILDKTNQLGTITVKLLKVKSLLMGMDTLQEFIWLLIATAVLWVGTFSILGEMEVAKTITSKIYDMGNKAATWASKTPYMLPIIPMTDVHTGKLTMGSLNEFRDKIVPKSYDEMFAGTKKFGKLADELAGQTRKDAKGNLTHSGEAVNIYNYGVAGNKEKIYEYLKQKGFSDKMIGNEPESIAGMLEHVGIGKEKALDVGRQVSEYAKEPTPTPAPAAAAAPAAPIKTADQIAAEEKAAKEAAGAKKGTTEVKQTENTPKDPKKK